MTDLIVYEPSSTVDEWLDRGKRMREAEDDYERRFDVAKAFGWGWWLQEGEFKFGEAYTQGMALTGKDSQTLANYKWLAGVYGPDEVEKLKGLSLKHFKLVAGRDFNGDRLALLDKAQEEQVGANKFESWLKSRNQQSSQNGRSTNGNGKFATTYPDQPFPDDMKYELAVQNHKLERKLDITKAKVAITTTRVQGAQEYLDRIIEKCSSDNPVFNELQELRKLLHNLAQEVEIEGWAELLRYWREGKYQAVSEIMENLIVS